MGVNLHYLCVGLGLFFVAVAIPKVAPLNPAHGHMTAQFGRFASVFPLKYVGFEIAADMLRALWAVAEVFFGALLAFGIGRWRNYSCIALFVMSLIQVYMLLVLQDPPASLLMPGVTAALTGFLLFGQRNYAW
ncbi:transmembrane protein 35B-like [Amphiura filiformis]|uniref:transmembrane protein 35B-like n=1 Tax=Amphiura filiformis TaxID=82378 RepID=UPI003B21953C